MLALVGVILAENHVVGINKCCKWARQPGRQNNKQCCEIRQALPGYVCICSSCTTHRITGCIRAQAGWRWEQRWSSMRTVGADTALQKQKLVLLNQLHGHQDGVEHRRCGQEAKLQRVRSNVAVAADTAGEHRQCGGGRQAGVVHHDSHAAGLGEAAAAAIFQAPGNACWRVIETTPGG